MDRQAAGPVGAAWRVVLAASRHTGSDFFTTAVVNLLWMLLTVLVITAPPAWLALFYVGNRMAREEVVDPGDFLLALRRYFWTSWQWALVNLAVVGFLYADVVLSRRVFPEESRLLVQSFYAALLVAWSFLQLYALPFLFEQEQPSVLQALRNGAVMFGRNISFSVAFGVLLLLASVAGVVFFLAILAAGGVFYALASNHAVLDRLDAARQ